ncbi:insulinase family protein [Bacteroidetes/Chlorobi group bacterium Naka2016]|jgi:predicted Zn-dependent peptidase|nr:MAG: insulinase family protein [Bacteroidetes/Chlorobi group bacterium Naka2016]
MKKISAIFLFLLIYLANFMNAEEKIDVTKKPEPLAEKEFSFPKYIETKLSTGMKVFIVEDHEQPTFGFRILIPGGSAYDGEKPGLAELVAEMLTKGAGKMSAFDIASKLDGVGAELNISANPDHFIISGFCLVKHIPVLLDVLSQVITNPTFPKDEFEKLKTRVISGIKSEKSRPMTVATNLSKKVIYGEKHPYGMKKTEESIQAITLDDVKNFYTKFFKPDHATLVITGDVKEKEILPYFEKAFAKWQRGKLALLSLPPIKPEPLGVYFIERPASVQSSIVLAVPTVEITNPDYEALDLAASIMGSGFAGRLFRTLRETYSYTYTPFGYQTSSKFANRFACGAEVRNQVTDSAIDVIKEQLYLLATEPPSEEELNRIKKVKVGSYLMSFENSDFIASLIQNAHFYGKPMSYLKDYPKIINSITPYDIQKVAKKYMHPDKAYIVVVGNPDVKNKLEKFGKIFLYDLDLKPISGEKGKVEPIELKPEEIIKNYIQARGGMSLANDVKTIVIESNATLSFQGQTLNGKIIDKIKSPLMRHQFVDFGMFQSEVWLNKDKSWAKVQGNLEEVKDREHSKNVLDVAIMKDFNFLLENFKAKVLGKQGDNILVKLKAESGFEATVYFDAKTYLINQIESTEDTPQGPIPVTTEYSKWEKVGNFLFPSKVKNTNPMFTVELEQNIKLNEEIGEEEFTPSK